MHQDAGRVLERGRFVRSESPELFARETDTNRLSRRLSIQRAEGRSRGIQVA